MHLLVFLFYGPSKVVPSFPNLQIHHFSARLDFLVPILSKTVPLRIRVKTLIAIDCILYFSILLALFKKKVVPPLQANNIN